MLAGITGMVALMLGLMLTIQCTLSAVFVKLHNIERRLGHLHTAPVA